MEPKEIRQKIRETIKARGPLLRREILAEFEKDDVALDEVDDTLNRLISLGVLYQAPRHRVSDFDVAERLKTEARRLISERPMSRKQLAAKLEKLNTGAAKIYLERKLFDELGEAPDVYLHFGGNNQLFLSTQPPSPADTLEPVLPRIRALEKAGIDRKKIQALLFDEVPSSPGSAAKAVTERDLDFQRDACELLVFAWQDAESPETRQSLEPVMRNLGLDQVEKIGAKVEFNGLLHECNGEVQKGEVVRVILPGWQLKGPQGQYVIAKAQVETIN